MLQRLDTSALSLPTVGVNTDNYAADNFSYYEHKNRFPNTRRLHCLSSQTSEINSSSFSSSITFDNNSWSDCTYSSASPNDLCYSVSISPSTVVENPVANNERKLLSAELEMCYADRQNRDDARNALDGVTEDQDELTDDEMTLFGDEIDLEMYNCNANVLLTPLNSSCEFTKKKEIPFVHQKSLLSSMLLHHRSPASASSSSSAALSFSSSSLISTCFSNHTTNDDVLSSSMKQYVHWEQIQNSGPSGLVGFQKNKNSRSNSRASSTFPITNSFDTSTSCW